MRRLLIALAALAAAGTAHSFAAESAPANPIRSALGRVKPDSGYRQEGYWVWCSSIIKGDDGKFHMYASRWPKNMLMHPGWMVASEIVHCVSDTAEGPYRFSDVALGRRGKEYWDGESQHNPRILRHGDTYVLFYMGSTHPLDDARLHPEQVTLDSAYALVGRANKRVGIATAKSPYGPWTRLDRPVLETKPGTFYSFLTSNPTPVIHKDGSATLVFKARRYTEKFPFYSEMTLGIAKAPRFSGPYTVVGDKPFVGDGSESGLPEMEDPYLWEDDRGFHLLAKDHQGKITGRRGDGILFHSEDALHWRLDPAPHAYDKTVTFTDGTRFTYGQMERAGGISDEKGRLTHLTFAVMDGKGGFENGSGSHNIVIPLDGTAAQPNP